MLGGTYFWRKADPVEALAHFGHLLQGQLLSPRLHPVNGAVVECFTGQIHNLWERMRECKKESEGEGVGESGQERDQEREVEGKESKRE